MLIVDDFTRPAGLSSRRTSKRNINNKSVDAYVSKRRYGNNYIDSDDEEELDELVPELNMYSPITKRNIIAVAKKETVKKLTPWQTYTSLIKGFIGTLILYIPNTMMIGGWLFNTIFFVPCTILTVLCSQQTLMARDALNAQSFSEIGFKLWGKPGRYLCDFVICASQIGIVMSYVYFIIQNCKVVVCQSTGVVVDKWWWCLMCIIIFTLLAWVRKQELFAKTHTFGVLMLIITVCVIMGYGGKEVKVSGWQLENYPMITWSFTDAIGFSITAFEGVPLIIPVYDITDNKELYPKIVTYVVLTCAVLFAVFGFFCVAAFDRDSLSSPLITDALPPDHKPNVIIWAIKILFILNLITSQPLQLTPIHQLIENYIYAGWPKTKKRQWSKNFTRFLMVCFVCVFTTILDSSINKFLAVNGAISATPVATLLPAVFHLKTSATTRAWVIVDWVIIIVSALIVVLCGFNSIKNWNDDTAPPDLCKYHY